MHRNKIIIFILFLFILNLSLYSAAQAASSIELTYEVETETSLELDFLGDLPAYDNYNYTYNGDYWYGNINIEYMDPDPHTWAVYISFIHEFSPHPDEDGAAFAEGFGDLINDDFLDGLFLDVSAPHGSNGHSDEGFYVVQRDYLSEGADIHIELNHVEGTSSVVPEPISSTLFLTGGGLIAGRLFFRRKN